MALTVEIRAYNLKPGTRDEFHRLFIDTSLPLLQRWQVDVVRYGPSLHDDDTYHLVRAFSSLEAREKSEEAFYASDEWRKGPREAIMALIENYTTLVIELEPAIVDGLRAG